MTPSPTDTKTRADSLQQLAPVWLGDLEGDARSQANEALQALCAAVALKAEGILAQFIQDNLIQELEQLAGDGTPSTRLRAMRIMVFRTLTAAVSERAYDLARALNESRVTGQATKQQVSLLKNNFAQCRHYQKLLAEPAITDPLQMELSETALDIAFAEDDSTNVISLRLNRYFIKRRRDFGE